LRSAARDAYQKIAPHPEQLQSLHDKSVQRMLNFKMIEGFLNGK